MNKIFTAFLLLFGFVTNAQDEIYELRTYELEFFSPAETLHNYLENALIPALNRNGINNVGVFEESSESLPKKVYFLVAHKNIQAYQNSYDVLLEEEQYQQDAKSYLQADPMAVPFKRYTVNLIRSTQGFSNLIKPDENAQLFELRIYNSYNEDGLRRKVKMFNDSEFEIFDEVGPPMVFFGPNIAGDQMPCLTYLLAFKNKKQHANAWAKFLEHPEWKRIVKLEEYANAMNEITRIFLKPLSYSQL